MHDGDSSFDDDLASGRRPSRPNGTLRPVSRHRSPRDGHDGARSLRRNDHDRRPDPEADTNDRSRNPGPHGPADPRTLFSHTKVEEHNSELVIFLTPEIVSGQPPGAAVARHVMYESFFGLNDKPFSLTPNPRFVFYSQQYREAEGQLLYGINNREGFMLVTGQPGTGKTTLCRDLIEKLDRSKIQSALIFNPFLNGIEMLAALLTEFGISSPPQARERICSTG